MPPSGSVTSRPALGTSRSAPRGIPSNAGIIGLGATGSSAAAGGDRDFGTLVWDIEAQSSVVSGAGTVGGGGKKQGGGGSSKWVGQGKQGGTPVIPIKSEYFHFFVMKVS